MVNIPITFLISYLCVVGTIQQPYALNLWQSAPTDPNDYGVDISFPIHHYIDKSKSPIGHKRYADMMRGCYTKFSPRECDATERARMEMNKDQPSSQHNYTDIGFKKMKAPAAAWEPLINFFEANKDKEKLENWPRGNTYVNSWDSPTYMVSFEDQQLRGGMNVKNQIWAGVKPILEEWTGHKLEPTSLYGIRVYKDGAMLSTHVDRLPLVSSCIIQVAQDIDEPWPIEVYDHAGKAYNVTMQPGEMVLYESHTVLHGRPFPMKGRLYANVFVHFQPVDHDLMNQRDVEEHNKPKKKVDGVVGHFASLLSGGKDSKSKAALSRSSKGNVGGHEQDNHDEEHVQRHMEAIDKEHHAKMASSATEKNKHVDTLTHEKEAAMIDDQAAKIKATLEAARRKADLQRRERAESGLVNEEDEEESSAQSRVQARFNRRFASVDESSEEEKEEEDRERDEEAPERHNSNIEQVEDERQNLIEGLREAAATGDYASLTELLDEGHVSLIHETDENDWSVLHEAIRGGNIDSVKLLVDLGASLTAKVASGGAALWVAQYYLGEEHSITQYLKDIGAPEETEEF